MREDTTLSDSFRNSDVWELQRYKETFLVKPEEVGISPDDPRAKRHYLAHSLSGKERNRLFMRTPDNFDDVSLVSGLDSMNDGRAFALFDYNDDGWLDIGLMSLNEPRFSLYENQFGKTFPENKSLKIKLVGGLTEATASESLSNRDGIGAKVLIEFKSGESAVFQKQAGEGFGSQNSDLIHVGVPAQDVIEKVTVQWPSGIEQVVTSPTVSELLTITEQTNDSK